MQYIVMNYSSLHYSNIVMSEISYNLIVFQVNRKTMLKRSNFNHDLKLLRFTLSFYDL